MADVILWLLTLVNLGLLIIVGVMISNLAKDFTHLSTRLSNMASIVENLRERRSS